MESAISFGELLKRFRKNYDYTQAETAKQLGYSEETIKSWEQGRRFPAREEVARLAGLMELDVEEVKYSIRVGRGQAQNARTRDTESGEAALLFAVANQFLLLEASVDCATWFGLKQTQIARVINQYIGRASSCDDLQHTVDQEIRAFANIRPQYNAQEYMLSRRQALTALACLPLSLFLGTRYDQMPSVVVEEILPRCAASITACWHLSRGSELAVIELAISSYLPFIKTLAQAPSPYQQTAAALAAQSCMLCAILALHRLDLQSREKYARQALHYSRIAQERNLESAALMYLGYSDGYARRPEQAIMTFENALSLSEASSPLSPLLLSDISMGLAEAYAQCQQEELAVKAITLARHSFPVYPELDPSFLYADCGLSSLYTYEGKMHLNLGQAKEAQQAFAQIERVQSGMSFSERNRTVRVIYQAQAALGLGDLEMCCAYLEEGRKGAVVLDSRRMSSDIFEVYLLAQERWPSEQRVRTLAHHFAAIQ
jgi:transcriptional regulator with XRE-family HTH domain